MYVATTRFNDGSIAIIGPFNDKTQLNEYMNKYHETKEYSIEELIRPIL